MKFVASRQPKLNVLKSGNLLTKDDWSITISGHEPQPPEFIYLAKNAGSTWWLPHYNYGIPLELIESTYHVDLHQNSPYNGEFSQSVKFNGTHGLADGDYFEATNNNFANIDNEDFVFLIMTQTPLDYNEAYIILNKYDSYGYFYYQDHVGRSRFRLYGDTNNVDILGNFYESIDAYGLYKVDMIFGDRSGYGQTYTEGLLNGTATDISSIGSLSDTSIPLTLGGNVGGAILSARVPVVCFAMWKKNNWLDTHLQPDIANYFYSKIKNLAYNDIVLESY